MKLIPEENLTHTFQEMSSCGICDEPASTHQHIECELCDSSYHLKCVGYTHSDYKVWSVRDNIFYMCDECRKDSTTQQYKEIKKVLSVIQQYTHKIDECVQNQNGLINMYCGARSGFIQ